MLHHNLLKISYSKTHRFSRTFSPNFYEYSGSGKRNIHKPPIVLTPDIVSFTHMIKTFTEILIQIKQRMQGHLRTQSDNAWWPWSLLWDTYRAVANPRIWEDKTQGEHQWVTPTGGGLERERKRSEKINYCIICERRGDSGLGRRARTPCKGSGKGSFRRLLGKGRGRRGK